MCSHFYLLPTVDLLIWWICPSWSLHLSPQASFQNVERELKHKHVFKASLSSVHEACPWHCQYAFSLPVDLCNRFCIHSQWTKSTCVCMYTHAYICGEKRQHIPFVFFFCPKGMLLELISVIECFIAFCWTGSEQKQRNVTVGTDSPAFLSGNFSKCSLWFDVLCRGV